MKRSTFLGSAGGALAATTLPFRAFAAESDIPLVTPTGTIYGTLTLPNPSGAVPVALIIAGSGPVDRNGNSGPVQGNTYQLLASALAANGVASLRYDKRGIAKSATAASSERALRFDTYVDDAAGWLRMLRADKRFSKVIIAGHSEGALVGTIAAQRAPIDALVTLEGAGRSAPTLLREQLEKNLPMDLYVRADAIIAQLEAGHAVANPPTELMTLFRPSVQPYLMSWFKYDPAVELVKVREPVSIVQGTADVQVTMTDADELHKAAPNAQFVVVNGMNHMLKHAPDVSSQAAILRGYEDPSLPVEPQVVRTVSDAVR
jgi:uncharacterized protein